MSGDIYPKYSLPNGGWTTDKEYADRIWAKRCGICGAPERAPAHAPAGNFNGGHDFVPSEVATS